MRVGLVGSEMCIRDRFCCFSVSVTYLVLLVLLLLYVCDLPCTFGSVASLCLRLTLYFWFCCFSMTVTYLVFLVLLLLYDCDLPCVSGSVASLCLWLTLYFWFCCFSMSYFSFSCLFCTLSDAIIFSSTMRRSSNWGKKARISHSFNFSLECLFPLLLTKQ